MKVSIITVTYNSAQFIEEQISSVKTGCRDISFEQIIVDNASTDNTVAIIEEKFPDIRLIKNTVGNGFGKANNQAASFSEGEYLLFLNPDMRITPGSLDTMVAWMDAHPDVGLASPKLIDQNGNINADAQPRRFPRVFEQAMIVLKLPHIFPKMLDDYLMKNFDPDIEADVDSVRGSFMLMRREVYHRLGWVFDPRYYIWFEDVDTCREVKRLGFRVVHTPVISAVDYIGQSFKQRKTLWKQKQFTKSMLQYFQKWEPWYKWMWIALVRPVGILMAYIYDMRVGTHTARVGVVANTSFESWLTYFQENRGTERPIEISDEDFVSRDMRVALSKSMQQLARDFSYDGYTYIKKARNYSDGHDQSAYIAAVKLLIKEQQRQKNAVVSVMQTYAIPEKPATKLQGFLRLWAHTGRLEWNILFLLCISVLKMVYCSVMKDTTQIPALKSVYTRMATQIKEQVKFHATEIFFIRKNQKFVFERTKMFCATCLCIILTRILWWFGGYRHAFKISTYTFTDFKKAVAREWGLAREIMHGMR